MNFEFLKHADDLILSSAGGHRENEYYNSTIESDDQTDMSIGGKNL